MVCSCRCLIVHSGKQGQVQLFEEGIVEITSLADLLIQGHRVIAILELKRYGNQSGFDFFCHLFGRELDLPICALANHEPLCQLN